MRDFIKYLNKTTQNCQGHKNEDESLSEESTQAWQLNATSSLDGPRTSSSKLTDPSDPGALTHTLTQVWSTALAFIILKTSPPLSDISRLM